VAKGRKLSLISFLIKYFVKIEKYNILFKKIDFLNKCGKIIA
jgi:hypothetical protein